MRRKHRTLRFIAVILILLLCALLLVPILSVSAQAYRAWTPRQERAHEIAELARGMGLPENDPIIVRASELWWEDANAKAYITD